MLAAPAKIAVPAPGRRQPIILMNLNEWLRNGVDGRQPAAAPVVNCRAFATIDRSERSSPFRRSGIPLRDPWYHARGKPAVAADSTGLALIKHPDAASLKRIRPASST